MQVELAHGGRGQSSSVGRGSGYASGGGSKYGNSRRSEFRGAFKKLNFTILMRLSFLVIISDLYMLW